MVSVWSLFQSSLIPDKYNYREKLLWEKTSEPFSMRSDAFAQAQWPNIKSQYC